MKNIHLIPTDKPSRFTIRKRTGELVYDVEPFTHDEYDVISNQNIYITDNSEIKEGDWFIHPDSSCFDKECKEVSIGGYELLQVIKVDANFIYHSAMMAIHKNKNIKKIILTTDQDLIKDGIQAIDDEFLEWFVKNPSCEFVETERLEDGQYFDYLEDNSVIEGIYENYKIIIPKEEPNPLTVGKEFYESADKNITVYRQETLEEVAEKWVFETNGHKWSNNDDTAGDNFASFIAGAKWQQEQDKSKYGEEEVRKISLDFFYHWWNSKGTNTEQGFDKWFEQLKKK
jgi:translation initiation factor 2 beta subunit (eIF-2beta)/eIF-5